MARKPAVTCADGTEAESVMTCHPEGGLFLWTDPSWRWAPSRTLLLGGGTGQPFHDVSMVSSTLSPTPVCLQAAKVLGSEDIHKIVLKGWGLVPEKPLRGNKEGFVLM